MVINTTAKAKEESHGGHSRVSKLGFAAIITAIVIVSDYWD